jgi:hypothetical protein
MAIEVGTAYVSITASFRDFGDQVDSGAKDAGDRAGRDFGDEFERGVDDGAGRADQRIRTTGSGAGDAGEQSGAGFAGMFGAALAALPVLAAGAVAGIGLAVIGLGAYVERGNVQVRAAYDQLASDVGADLRYAAAPLAPAITGALQTIDTAANALTPQLRQLFAGAAPDVRILTQGIVGMADGAMPGLVTAMSRSQPIFKGLATAMSDVGAGLGQFLANATTHASDLGEVFSGVGTAIKGTLAQLGTLAGGLSTVVGPALSTIAPLLPSVALGFGGMKVAGAVGAGVESLGVKLGAFGNALAGGVGDATISTASSMSKFGAFLSGPWGMAIGAGVAALAPLIGHLLDLHSGIQAVALSQQSLSQALAQDNGAIGDNTTAVVAATSQQGLLSKFLRQTGISQATWTQAVEGNTAAIATVHAATDFYQASVKKTGGSQFLAAAATAVLDKSLAAQSKQLAKTKAQQDQLQQTVNATTTAQQKFTAAVGTQITAVQAQNEQYLVGITATNQLAPAQDQLSQASLDVLNQFNQLAPAAQDYDSVLQDLYGTTLNVSTSEDTFKVDLDNTRLAMGNSKKTADQNAVSFDKLGAQALKVAEAVQRQTNSTQKGDAALRSSIVQIDNLARESGYSARQIDNLNMKLFGIHSPADIHIGMDAGPAIETLQQLEQAIQNLPAGVQIEDLKAYEVQRYASGGYAPAGQVAIVGEDGPELVRFGAAAYVTPAAQTRQLIHQVGPGSVAARSSRVAGEITINYYGAPTDSPQQVAAETVRRLVAAGAA